MPSTGTRSRTRTAPQAAGENPDAPKITVHVGQVAQKSKKVEIIAGKTVKDALDKAGISATGKSVIVRGEKVALSHVLQDNDTTLVVTGNVRGG